MKKLDATTTTADPAWGVRACVIALNLIGVACAFALVVAGWGVPFNAVTLAANAYLLAVNVHDAGGRR